MRSGLRWFWVGILVFLLDRFTKFFALQHLTEYQPVEINRFFNLTLAYNKGAAFSFLDKAQGWQTWFLGSLAVIVTVLILIKLKQISAQQRVLSIALMLVVAGALGNLFDRILYGHVIDFIQWHVSYYYWPVFNIADSAICVGAALLFYQVLMKQQSAQ